MHKSVGAIIRKGSKILLLDRAAPPYGFAAPAGHIKLGESPEQALKREVGEETGLKVKKAKLLFNEILENNWCKRGENVHRWFVFECIVFGELRKNRESKSIGWYSLDEIQSLTLEPSWKYFLRKLESSS